MAKKKPQNNLAHIYQHTNIAVYLVGFVAVASLIYDSTQVRPRSICWVGALPSAVYRGQANKRVSVLLQGIVQKYELNRKWFYLYGEHLMAKESANLQPDAHYLALLDAWCF